MKKKKHNTASAIGSFFAHFQSMIDDLLNWSFRKLKDVSKDDPPQSKEDPKMTAKIQKTAKKLGKFVGDMGESYYQEYEKLKADKVTKPKTKKTTKKTSK